MTRKECLDAAVDIVCKNRENTYGNPEDNFSVIAKLWSLYIEREITSSDVAVMMILLKIARIKGGNFKGDNYIDIAGYAACAAEIGNPEKQKKPKFHLENYICGKYAMHCDTKGKAESFCRFLHEHGKRWEDGDLFINNTAWETFKENTIYLLDNFLYQDVAYAENVGYQILEFDNFNWE